MRVILEKHWMNCAQITSLSLKFKTLPGHWIVYQSKNITLDHPKAILVSRRRLNVKIESERIDCTQKYFCLQTIQSAGLKPFIFFSKNTFFLPISPSSCDPSHWLRAQNAASALRGGPWERLGVGQGWHRQRDAGKVWSPSKRNSFYIHLCSSGQMYS